MPYRVGMMAMHLHWIQTYGYLGVFGSLMLGMFGLPIPDETFLAFTGFLVFKNYLQPVPALATAYLGSIFGITVNYLAGRGLGLPLLRKYGKFIHVTPEKLAQGRDWFEKYGKWSLFGGYFLPGVRHLTAFSAGVAGLGYKGFALAAYSGGLVWVVAFVALGYFVGEEWRRIVPKIESYLWALAAAVVFFGLVSYLVHRMRRLDRKPEQPAREE
jgi:membrane protein DedA with SNARE-associated domain